MACRFAPSPTGRFHIGNLRTAWVSHQWVRKLGLPWVLRFEDIDRPRVIPGAMDRQLKDMEALGLRADQVLVQSQFEDRHWSVFLKAWERKRVYPCFCSRKEVLQALKQSASAPHQEGPVYSGRCRSIEKSPPSSHESLAWRFRGEDPRGQEDFIIARTEPTPSGKSAPERKSFVPAYNWACAIDDWDGSYSLLVRAWDLEQVLRQQRAIHRFLNEVESQKPFPAVFHASLVTQDGGGRLEKRTQGVTLEELQQAGWTTSRILQAFERSFRPDWNFGPERVWGEEKKTLTLAALLSVSSSY